MQEIEYREMSLNDYDEVIELMKITPGVTVREADSRDATKRYFERNPGLSFVAKVNEEIVGCVMCGHDGRRGYLQHLIVKAEERRKGIGNGLVSRCLDALQSLGIYKTHIHVLESNDLANDYWPSNGWERRNEIYIYSYNRSENANA
ncbi:GNAT family N-acetyltransferase [Rubellicoccus peritrichatus]|uniref:GNAT family N-acetyltransferase n=1 Tax=Rubellicoccus peritrichatus TaxID=3080537 RepID=A0AAQ3L895_9BACT|nr:GNAT family N-acetyltransferase [Puniceicoccus sp. CR14]WOO41135.1 GNAT family N-acetyltransferase [Puniceicoccus sp. CR14]